MAAVRRAVAIVPAPSPVCVRGCVCACVCALALPALPGPSWQRGATQTHINTSRQNAQRPPAQTPPRGQDSEPESEEPGTITSDPTTSHHHGRQWSGQGSEAALSPTRHSASSPFITDSTPPHTMDYQGGDDSGAGTSSPDSRAQQQWHEEELDTLDLRESSPYPSTSASAAAAPVASSSSQPRTALDDTQELPRPPPRFGYIPWESTWREEEPETQLTPPHQDEELKSFPGPLAGVAPRQQPRPASGSWQDTDSEDDDDEPADAYIGGSQMRRASTNGHLSDNDSTTADNVCRICRCGPEPGQPLYHPCKCAGSIRYCHQDW